MGTAVETWEGEGGAAAAATPRSSRTLLVGVLYAVTIVVILAVVSALNAR